MFSLSLAVAAGVVGSIIVHYICKAMDRNLGNDKR